MFSWYKYLIVNLVFSHLGFWSGNLFLVAPFPGRCLLVPFYNLKVHYATSLFDSISQTNTTVDNVNYDQIIKLHLDSNYSNLNKIRTMEKSFDIEEFIKKYDVHPETITFLKAAAASGERPCHEIGVEAYRELFDKRNKFMAGETEFEGAELDLIVPSQYGKGKYT